jgi:type I restriction enzyme S subunit
MSAPLGELSDIVRGITFPASAKEMTKTQSNVCCLRTANIQEEVRWDDVYFVSRAFVKRDDQFVRRGDVLMSMANSYALVGKVAVARAIPHEAAFGAFLSAVRPREMLHGQYLFHYLRTPAVQRQIREGSSQTTNIANVSSGRLSAIDTPLAPLPEQKRIAHKLDALLARVDACRGRLEPVPAILKRFRKSVLAAATSGELTREWRDERGLRAWARVTIADVASLSSGFGFPPALQGKTVGELPFAKVSDISRAVLEASGVLATAANYIQEPEAVRIKAKPVSAGSTVFAKIGEGLKLNRRALAATRVVLDNNCMAATPDASRIRPRFLFLVLQTVDLTPFAVATAVPSVRRSDVAAVELGLPTLDEQDEVLRRTAELFACLDALEARLAAALGCVSQLGPTALAKAFRGELVPQDPTDEPASELLARLGSRLDSARGTDTPKRGRPGSRTKAKVDTHMLTRKDIGLAHLTSILEERGALTAEALWTASQLEIDDFYDQLKDEESRGLLRERRDAPNAPRLLEPTG